MSNVENICSHLEETAKMMGGDLSLSPASITQLEEILLAIKAEDDADSDSLDGASFMIGVYIGEIIRKEFGSGEWLINEQLQQQTLNIGDIELYPISQAKKFAAQPDSESLEFYVQGVLTKLRAS